VPEVDCCLTTGELQQLLEARGLGRLADVQVASGDALSVEPQEQGTQIQVDGAEHKPRRQLPLVLTLEALLQQQHEQGMQQQTANGSSEAGRLYGLPGGSGGYMEFVFRWGKVPSQVQHDIILYPTEVQFAVLRVYIHCCSMHRSAVELHV
jgi:iron only hydrogenase large subunit-like protein